MGGFHFIFPWILTKAHFNLDFGIDTTDFGTPPDRPFSIFYFDTLCTSGAGFYIIICVYFAVGVVWWCLLKDLDSVFSRAVKLMLFFLLFIRPLHHFSMYNSTRGLGGGGPGGAWGDVCHLQLLRRVSIPRPLIERSLMFLRYIKQIESKL